MSEWQPISTAPKDGTRLMLSRVGGPVWPNCYWEKMTRKEDRWGSYLGAVPFIPTHWMQLPPPPKEEA